MARINKTYNKWAPVDMTQALDACREGRTNLSKAARIYNVPRKTLSDRLKGKVKEDCKGGGRPTALSQEHERSLCEYIEYMALRAFPLTINQILMYAWCIDKTIGKKVFGENGPAYKWWLGFKKRHPEYTSLRKPDSLDRGKAHHATVDNIREYFQLLKKTLDEGDFHHRPQDIYNCDETIIDLNKCSQKVVIPKRLRSAHSRQVASSEHISLLCCVSASGASLPPFIIFKSSFPGGQYTSGGPDGALYGKQDSGFMDGELFYRWFDRIFLPHARPSPVHPVLLLLDGHSSHCSPQVIEKAKENNVILLALMPHSTHLCQPLDVAVYKSFKMNVSKVVKLGQAIRGDYWIQKNQVARIIKAPFEKSMSMSNIKSGFRKCGIFPYNPNAIDKEPLQRSSIIPSTDVDLALPPSASAEYDDELQPINDLQHSDDSSSDFLGFHDDDILNNSDYDIVSTTTDVSSEMNLRRGVRDVTDIPVDEPVPSTSAAADLFFTDVDDVTCACSLPDENNNIMAAVELAGTQTSSSNQFRRVEENPLVKAGIVTHDLASIFYPPGEQILKGRKRPLRIKSKARIMTSDEVMDDINQQRQEIALREARKSEKSKRSKTQSRGKKQSKKSVSTNSSTTSDDNDCFVCRSNWTMDPYDLQIKWVGCETLRCPHWVCPRCLPGNFNYADSFYCPGCD